MPRNTSITLGEHFDAFIEAKISEGRFASVSEAVRAGLRLLENEEQKFALLRAKLEQAELSPLVDDFNVEDLIVELDAEKT